MGVRHVALWVSDIDATEAFYADIVGLRRYSQFTTATGIENHYFGGKSGPKLQFKVDPSNADEINEPAGIDHIAMTVENVDEMVEHISTDTDHVVVQEPRTLNPPSGAVRIAFIRDPDGYVVELVQQL